MKTQPLRVLAGTAMTTVCVSAVANCGTPTMATADPADNKANNDKLFALLSGGFTPADCQAQGGLKPPCPYPRAGHGCVHYYLPTCALHP